MSTDSPLIIALDYPSLDAALCMADQLDEQEHARNRELYHGGKRRHHVNENVVRLEGPMPYFRPPQ